ncbi:tyrosine-type recombinase/integrase [Pseudorhodoferax sp.]|uniref:tyrosine-type recombinase/integrase n=1 Tax=Pseudorhodoferax sp. TaxID=1993553 RepID=UPI0039E3E4E6
MLTDLALRNFKPRATLYKVADRDGMYAAIAPTGSISFRFDYRINGRRETLTIGRYGYGGISLAAAREKLLEARRLLRDGVSPALQKQREKARGPATKTFGDHATQWLYGAIMAESTRAVLKSVLNRDILPNFSRRLLSEVRAEDLRALCMRVKERGAPATAIHVREVVKLIYDYANLHGEKVANPADEVGAASIAKFVPKDRALSPAEIQLMYRQLDLVAADPAIRLALRLILLTLVRKSELIEATWDEVDFNTAVWTIPKARMKGRRAHNVYLSSQALDTMIALRTYAAGSRYVLPSRYDADRCMSKGTLNRVTSLIVDRTKAAGLPLEPFTVHDLRRTGSTLLNEAGFNCDWIEKCLAHESGHSSRLVYNKAEYAEPRRHMLQEWANMVDAWAAGEAYKPAFFPLAPVFPTGCRQRSEVATEECCMA